MFPFRIALQMLPQPRPEVVDRYLAVAGESGRLLWEVIECGWPGRGTVGLPGAFAAAALLAHADQDAKLRWTALATMKVAVERGEADPRQYTHIVDRTRAFEGKPTCMPPLGWVVWVLANGSPEAVNVRRREIWATRSASRSRAFSKGAKPGPFLAPIGLGQRVQLGLVLVWGKLSLLGVDK
jgi:hypothetical protein